MVTLHAVAHTTACISEIEQDVCAFVYQGINTAVCPGW
jgi:hypothetical protein